MFFKFLLFLEHEAQLKDYEYVLHCYKFDLEPEFILVPKSELSLNLARSAQDDVKDSKVKPEDISPLDQVKKVSYEELKVLLETLDNECSRMAKVQFYYSILNFTQFYSNSLNFTQFFCQNFRLLINWQTVQIHK